jgi:hypothetical protein
VQKFITQKIDWKINGQGLLVRCIAHKLCSAFPVQDYWLVMKSQADCGFWSIIVWYQWLHQQKSQTRNISDVSLSQSTKSISLWQIKGAQSTQTILTLLSFNWQYFLKCSWSSLNRWCPTTCMIESSSKESLEVEATRDLWKYSQDLFSLTAPNSVVVPWGRLLPCQVYS